jgi:S-adenosylmethionine decarboxylase proenzyme
MKVIGLHMLAEIFDCDEAVLNDLSQLEHVVMDVVDENGYIVDNSVFHQYSSKGISGVVIIPQSHMMIHTWPEERYATVDMVTCSEDVDPFAACNSLVKKFGASHMKAQTSQKEIEIGNYQEAV